MDEGGKKLDWMYEGPSALVNREDYLLGRKVDKSLKLLEEAEQGNTNTWLSEAEKDLTPQSILRPSGPSGPIDVIKKIKDDPLYQIQKKEMEYRKQLLQNPILMKKLQKKHSGGNEAEGSSSTSKTKDPKEKKSKKKKKKHKRSKSSSSDSSSSDEEVDKIFNQLKKASDLNSLLGSSTKEKQVQEGTRRRRHDSRSDDEDDDRSHRRKRSPFPTEWSRPRPPRQHHRRSRSRSPVSRDRDNRGSDNHRRQDSSSSYRQKPYEPRSQRQETSSSRTSSRAEPSRTSSAASSSRIDEEELERRRQEMMGNAKQRDEERERVVFKHRAEIKKEQEAIEAQRKKEKEADFIRRQLSAAAESGSVEKRIKANSYNIQRSKFAMDKNFARR